MILGRLDARRAIPRPVAAAAVLALVGALVGGLVWALANGAHVVLRACLPGQGSLGGLGLRLALLRTSADCPEGALVLGGTSTRGALVLVSIAVPTLVGHLLAAACGLSASALLARAASGIGGLLGAALRSLPGAPRAPWVRAALAVGRDLAVPVTRVLAVRHPDRGPPACCAA